MNVFPIILAAGQGTRMHSQLPKVLHRIGGKPMLQRVIDACSTLATDKLAVVYGHGGEQVKNTIQDEHIRWILQAEQLGTGHAVAQANDVINDEDAVVIAYGDVPLIRSETLKALLARLNEADLCVLTTYLDDPFGYGRIVRNDQGQIVRIVEEKDADDATRQIKEGNTGFIAARGNDLKRWLKQLSPENAQGEYYLTDCIALAVEEGGNVQAVVCNNPLEVQGVNNRLQQAELERAYQRQQVEALMLAGASIADPARVDIRGSVTIGQDVSIDINTVLVGEVVLGDNVVIDSSCVITNSQIGAGTHIKPHSVIESAVIKAACEIGPFARIRPGAVLEDGAKVGNFVEIKKSTIGKGSKISHLSYIGDTTMGADVNIGAGTITCNYDGANKFETYIGDGVFVGSSTQLVAPVSIEKNTTIGAGSTITRDTPPGVLTLARAKQVTIKGWVRPVKQSGKKTKEETTDNKNEKK